MSDANVLLDIRGRNTSALRAIFSTKAALHGLNSEQRKFVTSSKDIARQNRDINRLLDRQSRGLKTLTGDYVALRRAVYTLGVRAAITGFAALAGTVTSLGADVVKLTDQVGMLSVGIGALSSSGIAGAVQGLGVWKLALTGVGKALTTTGHQHDLAMEKLTRGGRQLVRELKPLQKAYKELKQVAIEGLAPGLISASKRGRAAVDTIKDSAYNTAQALGYLVDHGVARFVKRMPEVRRIARENTITMRRMGDSVIEIGDAWLAASDAARPAVREMSRDVLKWARNTRKSMRDAKRDGSAGTFFADATRAWKIWTSTLGATGGIVGGVLGASADSAERLAEKVNAAAKAGERWVKSEKGQRKLKDGFKELEPLSDEIAKTLGATASTLVSIGIEGSDSATRILRGFRTQVLPLVHDLAVGFDQGVLQAVIDVTRETVHFVRVAQPGLETIGKVVGFIASSGADVLSFMTNMIERMPAFNQGVAGLALGAGILVGWSTLKRLSGDVLLSMRQMVGIAPKVRQASLIAAGPVAGGVGRSGTAAGGVTTAGRAAPQIIASGGGTGLRGSAARPMMPKSIGVTPMPVYSRGQIIGVNPGPRGTTRTSGAVPPMFRQDPNSRTFFSGSRVLPRLQPMPGVTAGDPLTGRKGGGSAASRVPFGRAPKGVGSNAGLGSFYGQVAKNSARGFSDGVGKGIKVVSPAIKTGLKFGFMGAALGGIIGALSSGELKSTLKNRIGGAFSGLTFGAIQSPDSRASSFMADVQRGIGTGGKVKLDARSDEQRALISKFGKSSLNLAKPEDLKRLKEWADVSSRVNKLSYEQATAIKKAADAQINLATRTKGAKDAMRQLHGAFIQESDLKPGVKGLDLLASHFREIRKKAKPELADVRDFTRDSMRSIKRYMVQGSESAKSATSKAFMAAAAAIKRGMREGTIDAEKGAAKLERIFRRSLAIYGIKGNKADRWLHNQDTITGKRLTDSDNKASNNVAGHARGGFFVGRPGERGQDNVPAVLNGQKAVVARGEYVGVFNGEQQQAFDSMAKAQGYGGMHGFFSANNTPHSRTKKFAQGGIVPIPGEPGESIRASILPDVMKLKRRYRLDITDGYAATGHAAGGEHPKGLAIDAIPGRGGSWDLIDRLAAWAKTKLGSIFRWIGYDGVPNHGRGNHIHLSWLANAMSLGKLGGGIKRVKADASLPGPIQGLVQGGLDATRRGATAALDAALASLGGTGVEGMEGGLSGATGNGAALMKQISRARGWNFADWWEVDRKETGHGANLSNPTSSARLRGQFLDMNYGKYGPGSDPAQHPTMTQQIQSMAAYIAERYGNPTRAREHHDKYNWYALGLEPTPPSSGQNAPTIDPRDTNTPSKTPSQRAADKKKKSKKKKKPGPYVAGNYPRGVKNAVRMSERLLHKGKRGKLKPLKLRAKVRKLRNRLKGGKWPGDPAWFDPLTGQPIDAEQQPMFKAIRALRNAQPGLVNSANRLADKHALTDESSTLSLTGADLRNWLRSQGSTPAQVESWIATYGDSLEVANIHGGVMQGKRWGGLDQFGAEINSEIAAHQAISNNWQAQSDAAKKTNTAGPIKRRKHRLMRIKSIFDSNRKVITRIKEKLGKGKKGRGWRGQIHDNDRIIDALQDHARNSRDLPEKYRDRIGNDIDSLRDLNVKLRKQKPKNRTLGMTKLAQTLDQRQRENALIAGQPGVARWQNAVLGSGLAGKAATSLTNWQDMAGYRGDVIDDSRAGVKDEAGVIAVLRKDLQDFKDAGWTPPPEKLDSGAEAKSERDELLKSIGLDTLAGNRLGQFQGDALTQFAKLLGMRFQGTFAHGAARITESGIALVHRNETIVPDPDGPFRNGMTMNRLRGGGGNGDVYLVAEGDVARLFKLIDLRVERSASRGATQSGAKVRAIRAAPGRSR